MTLALTFFLSTEIEELLTLRKKVARFEEVKEKLERSKARVYALYEDANYAEPFVPLVCGPRVGGLGCLLEERGEGGTFSRDCGVNGLHIFC